MYSTIFMVYSLGAFCKVHRGVMVSEEGGYHIENHVAIKHLKGEIFVVTSCVSCQNTDWFRMC